MMRQIAISINQYHIGIIGIVKPNFQIFWNNNHFIFLLPTNPDLFAQFYMTTMEI